MSVQDAPISFPGLFGDWKFTAGSKLLDIGNGVYWYGVLIAAGMLLAVWFCSRQAPKFGLTDDNIFDVVLWIIPLGVLGARLYYILFYLELYRSADGSLDFIKMIRIWDGGLAIYGGVIVGVLTVILYCRRKKLPVWALLDCCMMGVLIGQILGRWGNFMNREAYGAATDLPWRMRLWTSDTTFIDVHPTFLYESLWNLIGLALLYFVILRLRRFDGEITCCYFLWYGLGRFWIEGLRTDSLYLFDLMLFGQRVRVSQALSLVLFLVSAVILFYQLRVRRVSADGLWVNRKGAAQENHPIP